MNNEHAEAVAVIEAQMSHYSGAETQNMTRAEACRMAASLDVRTSAIRYLLGTVRWCESEKAELAANIKGLQSSWGAMNLRARREALELIVRSLDIPF